MFRSDNAACMRQEEEESGEAPLLACVCGAACGRQLILTFAKVGGEIACTSKPHASL